jgi:hypothetical protein
MKQEQHVYFVILLAVTAVLLVGCGYRFSPGGEHIDKDIRTVYVDNFANRTSEANVENIFRNSFIDQFRKTSRFRVAETREEADAVVKGSINNLSSSHLSYTSVDVAKEDRMTAVMELVFEERVSRKIIWSNQAFSWYGDYSVSSTNPSTTEANKRSALSKLADDFADRAFRMMMSGF